MTSTTNDNLHNATRQSKLPSDSYHLPDFRFRPLELASRVTSIRACPPFKMRSSSHTKHVDSPYLPIYTLEPNNPRSAGIITLTNKRETKNHCGTMRGPSPAPRAPASASKGTIPRNNRSLFVSRPWTTSTMPLSQGRAGIFSYRVSLSLSLSRVTHEAAGGAANMKS